MPAFDLPLEELEHYRPDPQEPADFEEFWHATLKEAAQPEVVVSAHPVQTGLRLTETWDVTFRGSRATRCGPGSADRPGCANRCRPSSSTPVTAVAAASRTSG